MRCSQQRGRRAASWLAATSPTTAASRLAIDWRRACSPARACRSTPARQALRSVSAAAPTMPGNPLIPSSSPSAVSGSTAVMASLQRIVVHRLRQPAREPRRQPLEGHDLQPVPPPPRRLEPQLPHPEQAVGDDCVARSRHPAHANSRKVASNPSNGSHERVLTP